MPSYSSHKRQMSVLDKDDDITWITVKGNHIPIKKGQSKEDAVKEFLESKKSGSSFSTSAAKKMAQGKSESESEKVEKPKEKSTKSNVHWVDPNKWNDPRTDPWYALYN